MTIEQKAQNVISAFNSEDPMKMRQATELMLRSIKREEYSFSRVEHPYLVAKSLFFMLTEEYLTSEQHESGFKLIYLCLLNNYLKNYKASPGQPEYNDLISGCKLAIVVFEMQHDFLIYPILGGICGYIIGDEHLRNQLFLFWGTIKEAKVLGYDTPVEEIINQYLGDLFSPQYLERIPIGKDLANLRERVLPIIEKIARSVGCSLSGPEDDFMWL